jgi:hypothetical protein
MRHSSSSTDISDAGAGVGSVSGSASSAGGETSSPHPGGSRMSVWFVAVPSVCAAVTLGAIHSKAIPMSSRVSSLLRVSEAVRLTQPPRLFKQKQRAKKSQLKHIECR